MKTYYRLKLLVRKNCVVKFRKECKSFLASILTPILVLQILVYYRHENPPTFVEECKILGVGLPSSGVLIWLQTFVCGLISNRCLSENFPYEGDRHEVSTNLEFQYQKNYLKIGCPVDTNGTSLLTLKSMPNLQFFLQSNLQDMANKYGYTGGTDKFHMNDLVGARNLICPGIKSYFKGV